MLKHLYQKLRMQILPEETSGLTKAQILQQASTAMLAQANKGKQGMLQLIQIFIS